MAALRQRAAILSCSHRRVYLGDLLAFKYKRDRARHEATKRMARMEVAEGTYDIVILPEGAEER